MFLQTIVELEAERTVVNTSITDMFWAIFPAAKVIAASLLQSGMIAVASSKKILLIISQ